jgi:hypothetical protein
MTLVAVGLSGGLWRHAVTDRYLKHVLTSEEPSKRWEPWKETSTASDKLVNRLVNVAEASLVPKKSDQAEGAANAHE